MKNTRNFNSARLPAATKTLMSNRHFVKYFKVVASFGIFAIFLGSAIFYAVESNNRMLKDEVRQMHLSLENRVRRSLRSDVENSDHKRAKRAFEDGDEEELSSVSGTGGVTYKRWGRKDCSGPNNELIYHGIGAAAHSTHAGGTATSLCLHLGIEYTEGRFINGFRGSSYLYGMEFRDSTWVNPLFNLSLTESGTITYHSVPCAICLAKKRTTKIMIPGQDTCPDGWKKEYRGYIMSSGHGDKRSSEAMCVDDTPQVVPGTKNSQGGAYVYMVEVQCTSLLCEPFVEGRELSCVVCTK